MLFSFPLNRNTFNKFLRDCFGNIATDMFDCIVISNSDFFRLIANNNFLAIVSINLFNFR